MLDLLLLVVVVVVVVLGPFCLPVPRQLVSMSVYADSLVSLLLLLLLHRLHA